MYVGTKGVAKAMNEENAIAAYGRTDSPAGILAITTEQCMDGILLPMSVI